jgi:hypothetical protein
VGILKNQHFVIVIKRGCIAPFLLAGVLLLSSGVKYRRPAKTGLLIF